MMSTDGDHSSENRYQALSAEAADDWPGAAPPAGWFLRLPTVSQLDRSPLDIPGPGRTADELADDFLDSGKPGDPGDLTGPISWLEGMDDPAPAPQPDPEPVPRPVPAPPPVVG